MSSKRSNAPPRPKAAPVAEVLERPPLGELSTLWAKGWPAGVPCPWEMTDACRAALAYVKGRGFGGSTAPRILPPRVPYAWWPGGGYRLAVLAYHPHGTMKSIHARDCLDGGGPKTKWPRGYSSRGLIMAGPKGAAFLRGETAPDRVVIVEGCTGLIGATISRPDAVVLAFTSGGCAAFGEVRWTEGVAIEIAVDLDEAGERYAKKLREAIPRHITTTRRRIGAQERT